MKKKIGLFLDDERVVADVTWLTYPENIEWIVVRNSVEFFDAWYAQKGNLSFVSFDHDIQEFVEGEEITGYSILKELVDVYLWSNFEIPQCFFHTQNPIGKKNMEVYYLNAVKFQKENKG